MGLAFDPDAADGPSPTRRALTLAGGALLAQGLLGSAAQSRTLQGGRRLLIAHRGGVVDAARPENSLAALSEAIRRGYSHVEVDLRITRDGQVVCLHDRSLQRTAGVGVNVDEVTLAELHSKVDPALVPTLQTYCARARGRIGLMPDVKDAPTELVDAFKGQIRSNLERSGLMRGALFIGRQDVIKDFAGPARVAWRKPLADFTAAVRSGDARRYFAFNHPRDFDRAQVDGFHDLGVQVIVTVNTLHYAVGDPMKRGEQDIALAKALGVDGLQIDSVYEPFAS